MYLIDTNVISEQCKQNRINPGIKQFFERLTTEEEQAYISAITVGELRRGVELIRYRGDKAQAELLDTWLQTMLNVYSDNILGFTAEESQIWGRPRVPHHENAEVVADLVSPEIEGVVRLGIPDGYGTYYLPRVLSSFSQNLQPLR